MMNDQEEQLWQRLANALFSARKTTDEGLFTYRVMERVRALEPVLQDLAWHRFLRWSVPMLGAAAASLILAARIPVPSVSPSIETTLFQQQPSDADPLSPVLENF